MNIYGKINENICINKNSSIDENAAYDNEQYCRHITHAYECCVFCF